MPVWYGQRVTLVTARCCTDWPVAFGWPYGRCGICGERPVIDWGTVEED